MNKRSAKGTSVDQKKALANVDASAAFGPSNPSPQAGPEFLLYQTEDGQTRIEVRIVDETVWMAQTRMAELFQVTVKTVNEHLQNIYDEAELEPERTIRKFRIVQQEGEREVRRHIDHYNLDAILAVGYRVKSTRGTQFRRWATAQLRDYLVQGFTLDDERFKANGGSVYFDRLLARIRDIRSSEKVFWRKVLDIYATSIDYDPRTDVSKQFFAIVQNKMHWAVHGQTAAELIASRADADKPNMGLTSWTGEHPRKTDVGVAKNYLNTQELNALNRIVTLYLEFAEVQAERRRPMTMHDWVAKLDDFLRISDYDILNHAGKVSAELAQHVAQTEFDRFRKVIDAQPGTVERDFHAALEDLEKKGRKRGKHAS
ncbi:hydroxyacid dehydrogenase [Dyella dinghuensis]|uniref:Hydroxyacid dehydrogenase n=1 Tax=Dyella dinghuensis TaxID=1920169 RepID=A0A432LS64_9GAMM|nr:virulence RhuM family protein [Dyella dinghuensis]RUL63140.1 hydroxyacid dehydrogenase [Dyella dinghuensis]